MKKNNDIKNNLDERQEQTLLRIEHNGFWITFFGLFISIIAQTFIFGYDIKTMAGELVLLMISSIYVVIACLKNGIWDRRLKANTGTNLIISIIAGLVPGALMFYRVYSDFPDKLYGSLAAGAFAAVFTFALCFAALSISAHAYKKRLEKLESASDSDEE